MLRLYKNSIYQVLNHGGSKRLIIKGFISENIQMENGPLHWSSDVIVKLFMGILKNLDKIQHVHCADTTLIS